jgi:hypothetical protein
MFRRLPSSRFKPDRYCPSGIGNWSGHLPFAADLIDALKPSLVVELGTHYGESYFGFCQAIRAQGLSCQAYAVDTWVGDSQTGKYGEDVFQEVSAHNTEHYQSFSTLLRTTFDEATKCFNDGSIDLLHLDGCHTYEAIQHDFGNWLPKVRAGGVILLHDTALRKGEFGAWRFWEEVSQIYPSFAFHHSCGLGVVQKGDTPNIDIPVLGEMLAGTVDPQGIRDYYVLCAERLQYAYEAAGGYASVCQVFWPGTTGYSEEMSSTYPVAAGTEAVVEFYLPFPAGSLRLDPCDCPGVIELSDIVVECLSSGIVLWRLAPDQFHEMQFGGTSIRMPDESRLILCSYGEDPQVYLPSLDPLNPEEPVRVRCRFRIDRGWQAIERLWRQVEAGLARARRETEGHARHAERLEGDLAQAAAQAASQAARHYDLLDQQRRRAEDAESVLLERTTQLADVHSQRAEAEQCARESEAATNRLEDQVRTLREDLENVKQRLAQEQSARTTAEEEARSLLVKLSRFPVRLFVR